MTDVRTCPRCGATLPPGTEPEACPRCLLELGLDDDLAALFPELEILERLGHGGMGVVYKARQRGLDRLVALKLLSPSLSEETAFAERFAREARAMARLDHPSIVRVHDFGEREGRYFLLMEYVDGTSLREVMAAGGLEPQAALAVVPRICDALQYAHDRGVVHRDIKPENVLLDRAGRVKIADFGLAKLAALRGDGEGLTRIGEVVGTPRYMAPEQVRTPGDVDHRADIYALGVVFYEMLTGQVPMGRFAPPSRKVAVDVRLDEIVLRTLEDERERRYQRADTLGTEVEALARTPPRASPRTSRLALVGFLCLPAAILLPIVGVVLARLAGGPSVALRLAVPLPFALLLAGFATSLAGWIAISRSRGALSGLGFAVAGTVAPIPLLLVALAVLYLLLSPVEAPPRSPPGPLRAPFPTVAPAVPRVGIGPPAPVPSIASTVAALGEVLARPDVRPADLDPFLAPTDRRRIHLARREDVRRLGAAGLLGLPLLASEDGGPRLEDHALGEVDETLDPATRRHRATVRLRAGGSVLEADLAKEEGAWRFLLEPVRRDGALLADGSPGVEGGPDAWGAKERWGVRAQVELLWSVYRGLWEASEMPLRSRVPRGALPWLLPPSPDHGWRDVSSADLAARGRDGSWGLLFLDASRLPAPLADYRLSRVRVDEAGSTAEVVMEAGTATLRFPVRFEDGRAHLGLGPVGR